MAEQILFIIFGILAVGSAICVIAFRNPIHSALALGPDLLLIGGVVYLVGSVLCCRRAGDCLRRRNYGAIPVCDYVAQSGKASNNTPNQQGKGVRCHCGNSARRAEAIYIGIKAHDSTAVSSAQGGSEAVGAAITSEQLNQIAAIESTYQLDRAEINSAYVPEIAQQKNTVETLTASEANQLIKKLQGEMGKPDRIGTILFTKYLIAF